MNLNHPRNKEITNIIFQVIKKLNYSQFYFTNYSLMRLRCKIVCLKMQIGSHRLLRLLTRCLIRVLMMQKIFKREENSTPRDHDQTHRCVYNGKKREERHFYYTRLFGVGTWDFGETMDIDRMYDTIQYKCPHV